MSELQNRLDKLMLRLDHMGMRVEQSLIDALHAVEAADADAGEAVHRHDAVIDREEVEIEQECIRLLALYQPAAIDLRTICTIIKVNNDLERIADFASGIGKRVKHVAAEELSLGENPGYVQLSRDTLDIMGRTARILSVTDPDSARRIIDFDKQIDQDYKALVHSVLHGRDLPDGSVEVAMTVIQLARALERVGDLCTNIAEDVIFLRTGDIVRHAQAFDGPGENA